MAVQGGPVSDEGRGPDLLVPLDRSSPGTLHDQLERGLRDQIRSGRLPAGSRLPSSRALASALGVSRGVVLEAYTQLTAEGYLTASQGAPTRVSRASTAELPPLPAGSLEARYDYDFDPALPDLTGFPRERWMRSMRVAASGAEFAQLGHRDPRGLPDLRNELMTYLGRIRGAAPEPEHTVICAGFSQGFAVVCSVLAERGIDRIAVEDPCWPVHRLTAEHAGLDPVPIPVDEHGLDVASLEESECEVIVVSPTHQYPIGVVLSPDRRAALLEWAEDHDGLIIEDDYDSELRYDRVAIGALQGLAPERVCQIGSFSKRLAPGLRLGWILSPSWLTGALTYEKGVADGGSPVLEQLALADFIARGELDRHLRRMRVRYRERRELLAREVVAAIPDAQLAGVPAGVSTLALLPDAIDARELAGAAASHGIRVEAVTWMARTGLLLGFGSLPPAAIERGVRRLYALTDI